MTTMTKNNDINMDPCWRRRTEFSLTDDYIKLNAPEFTDMMRIYTLAAAQQHTKKLNNVYMMEAEPINVSDLDGREVFGFRVFFRRKDTSEITRAVVGVNDGGMIRLIQLGADCCERYDADDTISDEDLETSMANFGCGMALAKVWGVKKYEEMAGDAYVRMNRACTKCGDWVEFYVKDVRDGPFAPLFRDTASKFMQEYVLDHYYFTDVAVEL